MLSQSAISGATISGNSANLDTNPPTMVGSLTSSNVTLTSFTLTWQAATDETAVTGYEVSTDGGSTYTAVGNVLTTNKTGLSPNTTYNTAVRAFDAAGNKAIPLTLAVKTAADTTAPVMVGSLTISSVTASSFTATWQSATDNLGVTGYKVSKDGGNTYTDVGNVLTYSFTGLSAGVTYNVSVFAYDAAGNNATPLTATATTPDTVVPVMVGTLSSSAVGVSSFTLNWQAATDNVAVTGYEYSGDNGASYSDIGNVLTYTKTSLNPATTYNTKIRAYDAAGNRATPLSLAVTTAADVNSPVMVGNITSSNLSSSSVTLAWQAATDNVAVTGYEVSYDNGTSYTSVGNVLTVTKTGLTPVTTYSIKVRAFDSSSNKSSPLSISVTTPVFGTFLAQTTRALGAVTPATVTLGATPAVFVYTKGSRQDMALYNKSASNVVVTFLGSMAGIVNVIGTGGLTADLTNGWSVLVPPGFMRIALDRASAVLVGSASVSANTENAVVACLMV